MPSVPSSGKFSSKRITLRMKATTHSVKRDVVSRSNVSSSTFVRTSSSMRSLSAPFIPLVKTNDGTFSSDCSVVSRLLSSGGSVSIAVLGASSEIVKSPNLIY